MAKVWHFSVFMKIEGHARKILQNFCRGYTWIDIIFGHFLAHFIMILEHLEASLKVLKANKVHFFAAQMVVFLLQRPVLNMPRGYIFVSLLITVMVHSFNMWSYAWMNEITHFAIAILDLFPIFEALSKSLGAFFHVFEISPKSFTGLFIDSKLHLRP